MTGPAVVFENVTRRFGATVALNGVGFAVEPGSVLGLIGRNGAGKLLSHFGQTYSVTGYLFAVCLTWIRRAHVCEAEPVPRRRGPPAIPPLGGGTPSVTILVLSGAALTKL